MTGDLRRIEVVPYDSRWSLLYEDEASRLRELFGDALIAIHHIGSTAIPGIHAKPVIDLLVEAQNLEAIDVSRPTMASLGHESMGEFGIPGRRYFRKDDANGIRTHQVHVFEIGSPQVARHLAFRDFMIAHPNDALRYSDLKRRLAKEHPFDPVAFMVGKDPFIQEIDRRAAIWKKQRSLRRK